MNFRRGFLGSGKFRSVCYQKYQLETDQHSFVPRFPFWDVQFDNQIMQAWRETLVALTTGY